MSELDALMAQLESKYEIEILPLTLGDKVLKIAQLKNMEEHFVSLLNQEDLEVKDLPFWAKIWEASFLLAYFMGKQPVALGRRILEIGAGIGVVGIYAALCGHRVVISDINEEALLFARVNVLLNNATQAEVRKIDWNDTSLQDQFDVIIGSEVVYDRECYPLLVDFLNRTLAPGGVIFLAKHHELDAPKFFTELTKFFEFKENVRKTLCNGEAQKIALYAIRRKGDRTMPSGVSGPADFRGTGGKR